MNHFFVIQSYMWNPSGNKIKREYTRHRGIRFLWNMSPRGKSSTLIPRNEPSLLEYGSVFSIFFFSFFFPPLFECEIRQNEARIRLKTTQANRSRWDEALWRSVTKENKRLNLRIPLVYFYVIDDIQTLLINYQTFIIMLQCVVKVRGGDKYILLLGQISLSAINNARN